MHHRLLHAALRPAVALSALWLAGSMTLAQAASPKGPDIQYQREMQACKEGRSGQDTATCMTEARRALAARRDGALQTDTSALADNARKRCQALAGNDKTACLARMDGGGTTSGSVAGGGILREVETVVAPSDAASEATAPNTAGPVMQAPTRP